MRDGSDRMKTGIGKIGAQHVEASVGEVEDHRYAEHEGQAGSHQEEEHTVDDAVNGLDEVDIEGIGRQESPLFLRMATKSFTISSREYSIDQPHSARASSQRISTGE